MSPAHNADTPHFWFGEWLSDAGLHDALAALPLHLDRVLARPFPLDALLGACDALAHEIAAGGAGCDALLRQARLALAEDEAREMMQALAAPLRRDVLEEKLRSELGSVRPGVLERRYPGRQYEAWQPLGSVVHVMPSNVLTVGALGLVESLLGGNLNVVKVGARDTAFTAIFAGLLAERAVGAGLAEYMAVVHVPSQDQDTLARLFAQADVISAWGGEAAITAVRRLAPANARVLAWGHKVSFAYLAEDCLDDAGVLEAIARDICRLDQQACSSPQTLLVEAEGERLDTIAEGLAQALARISPTLPRREPDMAEQAEITTVVSVTEAEQALGLTRVIADAAGQWRLLLDQRPGLRPSPLYRTLWIKPVQRAAIGAVLRPMRPWLQTCGLAATRASFPALARQLLAAGVTRITRPGEMIDSYTGAPHDGVYALQHLTRRVSVDGPGSLADVGSFAQFEPAPMLAPAPGTPILTKAGFQALGQDDTAPTGLLVRSGGSSGQVAYSRFRWPDYARQMLETSHGLVAAGLDPAADRVMNLFAAGYLYGSFISFWTILENLGVEQLPMAMVQEYELIADQIIEHRVNVLLGMTPHLLGLFVAQGERLKAAGCIDKVFYGGEALSSAQRAFLTQDCGVPLVRSVAYGSNDAGPMGYQCEHCEGSVHHLFSGLQHLEIVALEEDAPVADTQIGRLLLSSRARSSPRIERYEIGDTGRWVAGDCPCGRRDPRFELTGRLGDVFKAGSPLLNYGRFVQLLDAGFGYAGPLQVHVDSAGATTLVRLWVDASLAAPAADVAEYLMTHYEELGVARHYALPTQVRIETRAEEEFLRVKASGKLRHVIDHRAASDH
ncbi:hypothetical protein FOZ76_11815 [Verticiella sediminum]|uniref:long-chain-fatty-acyl-CoA reductase n=1 Tax=Verticiella sediminum TaxID=1247510 RepID=A0A556APL6_9BURK|nr:acyl-CoA reductase [Verticiella sediminum]TSH94824.1 hypothetical protein FOZ76_11815 [Verticiella sediminum]